MTAAFAQAGPSSTLSFVILVVITGFNTDVEFDGVTYHVQTEDKGLSSPMIMSLIYDRGTILASKRTPYDDLIASGFDEKVLSERLQKQHRLICAAVQAGRLDDLKKLSSRDKAPAAEPAPVMHEPAVNEVLEVMPAVAGAVPAIPKPLLDVVLDEPSEPAMLLDEFPSAVGGEDTDVRDEPEFVIPQEAVEIVSDLAGFERPDNDNLRLDVLGGISFKAGESRKLTVMVARGSSGKVVPEAQIMIKIVGADFGPRVFHSTSDRNGLAMIDVEFPEFRAGRAACLIRAMHNGDEVEVRRPVTHA